MRVYVGEQLLWFLISAGLGAGLGLIYDLFRALRRKKRGLTPLVDFLFALVFFLSLMALALYTPRLRIYHCVGLGMGALLYFLTASPFLLRVFLRCLGFLGMGLGRILGIWKKSMHFLRKLEKKFFASRRKWSTIDAIPFFHRLQILRHASVRGAADPDHSECAAP